MVPSGRGAGDAHGGALTYRAGDDDPSGGPTPLTRMQQRLLIANDAISLSASCKDQAEVDKMWDALIAGGGKPVQCGWLKDKFGVSWQIVPEEMEVMMRDRDPVKSKRVMEAMMKMRKIDIAMIEAARTGETDNA